MSDELGAELERNIRKSAASLRQRAISTPDDMKVALQAIGRTLMDHAPNPQRDIALGEFRKLREYIGFLQFTCAANLQDNGSDNAEGNGDNNA